MAAPTNGAGNLVDEFEESFQSCLNVLTKQETGSCVEKEEVKVEVERFIELGRQMEAFFLQKRFLLSALKPELLVKEDNNELRLELTRKEELLKRHYDKIGVWQNLLNDLQGYAKGGTQPANVAATGGTSPAPNPQLTHAPHNMMQGQQMQLQQQQVMTQQTQSGMGLGVGQPQQQQNVGVPVGQQPQGMGVGVGVVPQQPQHQMAAQMQLQQMHHQQQQHQHMQQMGGVNQGMFLQQGGPFQPGGALQGPLAYLEKTTTNIDLVGMGDGRR